MLDDAAVFAKVVECQSFSRAARELNTSHSSVSKRIHRLEKHFDTLLLYRNSRGVQLTTQGEAYYAVLRQALDKATEAEQVLREASTLMQGVIRIAAGPSFTNHVLAPALAGFVEDHPGISFHLSVRTEPISAASEGADIMFQWGDLKDSGMIATQIMRDELLTVCAPSYYRKHSLDTASEEEIYSSFISASDNYVSRSLYAELSNDTNFGFPQIVVDDIEAVLALVIAGAGVTTLPRFAVIDHLKHNRLVVVSRSSGPYRIDGHAVFHAPPSQNPRISKFMDYVKNTVADIQRQEKTLHSD
ncbi:MAG: LysR family transcriptional regulator [Pseudomonadota bacterium]